MSSLDDLATPGPLVDGRAPIDLPDGWQQGRGAFGGLVTAVMTRTLEAHAPGRPLRSLTAELCGPVQPGAAELVVETLRAGHAVTTAAVRLVQGGEVMAHAVGVLGSARMGLERAPLPAGARGVLAGAAPPVMPAWRDTAELAMPPGVAPVFSRHFEYRVTGPRPFAGGTVPEIAGWIRPRTRAARRDAAYLAACIDAYWPALFSILTAPRPMATIAFTLQPLALPAPAAAAHDGDDAPLFFRAQLVASDAGYCVEHRELWQADGTLLALNEQTFVVIQ